MSPDVNDVINSRNGGKEGEGNQLLHFIPKTPITASAPPPSPRTLQIKPQIHENIQLNKNKVNTND
jgi:hypothetical protein